MSVSHWIVVAIVAVLLFGRGKISDLMGDVGKGIKSFKQGLKDDATPQPAEAHASLPQPAEQPKA